MADYKELNQNERIIFDAANALIESKDRPEEQEKFKRGFEAAVEQNKNVKNIDWQKVLSAINNAWPESEDFGLKDIVVRALQERIDAKQSVIQNPPPPVTFQAPTAASASAPVPDTVKHSSTDAFDITFNKDVLKKIEERASILTAEDRNFVKPGSRARVIAINLLREKVAQATREKKTFDIDEAIQELCDPEKNPSAYKQCQEGLNEKSTWKSNLFNVGQKSQFGKLAEEIRNIKGAPKNLETKPSSPSSVKPKA